MKYRKKPVVIEAFQWPPKPAAGGCPDWFYESAQGCESQDGAGLTIHTLEGDMTAQPGDWIIRGVKGELYPCKPDIFAETYEPAGD
jgi:hypothetical protein